MLVLWRHIKYFLSFFFFQVVFPLFQGVFVDVRCVYDMYMVLFKPSWPFLRGNFGDKLLLDMYIFPLANLLPLESKGKSDLIFILQTRHFEKKTKKARHFVKKRGGYQREGELWTCQGRHTSLLLAGETFLGVALAPLNTIEMSWGRWC